MPDGTIVKSDGTMVYTNGTMVKPDKTIVQPDGTMIKPDGTIVYPNGTTGQASPEITQSSTTYSGQIIAGSTAPLIDFNKADYDTIANSGKIIVLYFYASWCPICKAEVPHLYSAFNELSTDKVVGFRVNFNDGDTDNDERSLASQFGIAYQHTKVFVKDGERILKSAETWDKARYLSEINKVLA